MSPVGRVFVVLNLLLAGAFVGFSGTYLQKATDWKKKHDDLVTSTTEALGLKDDQIKGLTDDRTQKERQLVASETNLRNEKTRSEEFLAENERLQTKLNSIEGDLAKLQSEYTTIASSIERATQDSAQARQAAIEAGQAKDVAIRAQAVAEADLRDANDKVSQLEASLGERDAQIGELTATVRQKDVLIAFVNTKAPGLLTLAQPDLSGTVQHVDAAGKLLTVAVTDKPDGIDIKPGYSFAIFAGETYKGEALVTDVEDRFAFCRVTKSAGPSIEVGDQAATNTH